jgi:hypothetical protein
MTEDGRQNYGSAAGGVPSIILLKQPIAVRSARMLTLVYFIEALCFLNTERCALSYQVRLIFL